MADIHLNLDPSSKKAVLRHCGRIRRLLAAKAKAKYSNHRDNFQAEIDRRTKSLQALDITVPITDAGWSHLMTEVSSSKDGGQ